MTRAVSGGAYVSVGVDGSETALRAARWAAHEAHARGTELRVVHAADYVAGPGLRHRATVLLGRALFVARQAEPGLVVHAVRIDGPTVSSLVDAAGEAELMVLGMRGQGGPTDTMFVSTAFAVAMRSATPVAVVHRRSTATRGDVVVGAADLTDDDVLACAHDCAVRYRTTLRIVHGGRHADDDRDAWEELARRWDRVSSTVPVRLDLDRERPSDALLTRSLRARLVVVGSRSRRVHALNGSTTRALLHGATSPVLVVPTTVPEQVPGQAPEKAAEQVPAPAGAADPHDRSELW